MDFEEANSQVDSLCGALPRDDLRMHKWIKSDISKVMYQMKCIKVGRSKPPPVLTSGFNRLKPPRSI